MAPAPSPSATLAVTEHWQTEAQAGHMSPATIQTYFGFMRTFAGWIGKPRLLQSHRQLLRRLRTAPPSPGLPRGHHDHEGPDDSVSDPRRTLAQAERHLRYVMERHGITRAGLKVVPHGLRHQDAADAYRAMTGQPPPVAGGGTVDAALDARARQAIAEHLGHGRPAIVNAYLGRPRLDAKASSPAAYPNPDTRNPEPQGDE